MYSKICKKDEKYLSIKAFLNKDQDLIIMVTDVLLKKQLQELVVPSNDYYPFFEEFYGLISVSKEISFTKSVEETKDDPAEDIEWVDYGELIEANLEYDEVDQKYVYKHNITNSKIPIDTHVSRVATLQTPENRDLLGIFGTQRGSLVTSSIN